MSKPETQVQVVIFCRENHLPAEVVGRWVWIRFDEKPSLGVRQTLKAAGFRWSSKREQWYHRCGWNRTGRGGPDPRYRYGSVSVNQISTDDVAA